MMLILIRSNYVKNIYYLNGGYDIWDKDNSELIYTEERIFNLLNDFVAVGFETSDDRSEREVSNNPICPFCEGKMVQWDGSNDNTKAKFECLGCKSISLLKEGDFIDFKLGLNNEYYEVLDMRRKKIYDPQGKFLRPWQNWDSGSFR